MSEPPPNKKHKPSPEDISNATGIITTVSKIIDSYVPELYLYHLEQDEKSGWDTYSDCVVVASSEEVARNFSPSGHIFQAGQWHNSTCFQGKKLCESDHWHENECFEIHKQCIDHSKPYTDAWASDPNDVEVKEMGILTDKTKKEGDIICRSYHAG